MSISVGDKVRFLSETGGGTVTRFKGKDMVLVEDEDGFEVPVLIRECVVIPDSKPQVRKPAPPVAPPPVATVAPEEEAIVELPGGERLTVYLAYLPIDPKAFQQTGYEVYFVNSSNYYLFFNYMNRQNNSWISRYCGEIEPNMRIFLEEFGKEDLNDLERICIQFIAYKRGKPFSLKNAVSVELHLDIVKFYKKHCFLENDFFEEEALLYPVVREDLPERELLISAVDLQESMMQKLKEEKRTLQPAAKSVKEVKTVVEVDLHIHELLETTSGMNNSEILACQLDKFHEVLKQYVGKKNQKIVFIHGKGDGVLRKAIEKELKTKYKSFYFQDASFREYGFGATMVTIK